MKPSIYKVTNKINSKIYVGQTHRSLETRFDAHVAMRLFPRKYGVRLLSLAISKYGKENFSIELIEELPEGTSQSVIDEREIYWGNHYNSLSPNGYNLKLGFGLRSKWSDEVKKKIGDAHRNKIVSKETRRKLSKIFKGRIISQKTKDLISKNNCKYWLGKKRSKETSLKIAKSFNALKENGWISPLSKSVEAICDGKVKYKFNSMHEAELSEYFDRKVSATAICSCIKGKLKSCGKLNGKRVQWRYSNDA